MEKISIIIPVYNVEDYLDRCIKSVVSQTYKNLEIILVDDGSTDICPAMCDKWADNDIRIKVIHKKNGGLSDARNAGMKEATGKYFFFIDSDDFISSDCIECLKVALDNNNCQIAIGSLEKVCNDKIYNGTFSNSVRVVNKFDYWKEYYINLFDNPFFSGVLINGCCKLIERSLFDNIEFPYGKINEDTFTTYRVFDNAKSIAIVDRPLYFYEIRSSSISHKRKEVSHFDILDALEERVDYFVLKCHDEQLIKYAFIDLLDNQIERYLIAKSSYENLSLAREIKKKFVATYNQANKYNAFDTQLYKKRTPLYRMFYINEYLFRITRKIARKLNVIR